MKKIIIGCILSIFFVCLLYINIHKCPKYWSYEDPCEICYTINSNTQNNKHITVEMLSLNNPFLLDSNSQFVLSFNRKCIYKGQYRERLLLTVPDTFIDKAIMPSIFMQKGKCSIGDTFKGSCFRLDDTCANNGINILFTPERGRSPIFYMSCRQDE